MNCQLDTNAITIVLIMLTAGILGGYTNYLVIKEEVSSTEGADSLQTINRNLKKKSLFLGVSASLLVPLFLTTISSSILDFSLVYPLKNYFIFGGFCLLAAISSKRFIEDVYSRIIKAENEAKAANAKAEDAQEVVKELQESNTEVNEDDYKRLLDNLAKIKTIVDAPTKEDVYKVVKAFIDSKYSYRTASGVAKESNLNVNEVERILNWLKELDISNSKLNRKGHTVWKIQINELLDIPSSNN